jgi:hypothetical protein
MFHAIVPPIAELGDGAELTEIEYLVDVEHDQEPVIEPMHPGADLHPTLIEIYRVGLVARRFEPQHISHPVDDQP